MQFLKTPISAETFLYYALLFKNKMLYTLDNIVWRKWLQIISKTQVTVERGLTTEHQDQKDLIQ